MVFPYSFNHPTSQRIRQPPRHFPDTIITILPLSIMQLNTIIALISLGTLVAADNFANFFDGTYAPFSMFLSF